MIAEQMKQRSEAETAHCCDQIAAENQVVAHRSVMTGHVLPLLMAPDGEQCDSYDVRKDVAALIVDVTQRLAGRLI